MPLRTVNTELQSLLKIEHPLLLAGMGNVSTAELVAAVSNAGGLGVMGGFAMKPKFLRKQIASLKKELKDPTAFGVDLLLPKVGGGARATNYDYTEGHLPELIDIVIESKARLFVSAVGLPPKWVVEKLQAAGILVANMCGHPKHARAAADLGCDMVIAQGYEAGGHTGSVATMVLIPQVIDAVKGRVSPLTGKPMTVVAAGGIYDGRTSAAAFALGASGVWVGTRFVASTESTASKLHKSTLVKATATDAVPTLIYTGRPLRTFANEIVADWEKNKQSEIKALTSKGKLPYKEIFDFYKSDPKNFKKQYPNTTPVTAMPMLMGQACGGIHDVLPAAQIVEQMMSEAVDVLDRLATLRSKL
eukprot:TRINITY_DN1862_c0_g1_i1.p1 TRINITY_DN1862_c0_g1~~TRINITY_DN1862_c0_g1_i1.p1  ORF type:complete len:383 (+),score=232.74 TRINITY_DN1862_c0_g1_i1:69-1151(+)